MEEQYYQNRQT